MRAAQKTTRQILRLCWRKAKRSVEWALYRQFDNFFARLHSPIPSNRIVICNTQLLGDYFLWKPYARACIEHWRHNGKPVVLVCNAAWKTLAELDLKPDAILGIDTQKFLRAPRYRLKTLRQLRLLGSGTAMCFSLPRDGIVTDACMRAIAAPISIGFSETFIDRPEFDVKSYIGAYTALIALPPGSPRIGYYRAMLESIDSQMPREEVIPRDERHPDVPQSPYFVVSPCASRMDKVWPADRFTHVIRETLFTYKDLTCILIGAPSERNYIESIREEVGSRALNLAGANSLNQMRACIRDSIAVLGNDSAAIHIASAYGIPSLVVMNGATYGQCIPYPENATPALTPITPKIAMNWMPCFGCEGICQFPTQRGNPLPCLEKVSTQDVTREFQMLISRGIELRRSA